MAMTKCKECGADISTKAEACPKCGAKPPKRTAAFTWIVTVLMSILVAYCTISDNLSSREREQAAAAKAAAMTPAQKAEAKAKAKMDAQRSDAKWQCREFVERSLKAPASAEFQSYNQFAAWGSDDGPYGVDGYVDAQNSFGAKIRAHFTCLMEKKGGTWRLIELKTGQ